MTKIRVYELARELNVENKALLTRLKTIGVKVASHQSTLTDEQIVDLRAAFGGNTVAPAGGKPAVTPAATGASRVIIRRRAAEPEVAPAEAAPEAPTPIEATAPEPVVAEPAKPAAVAAAEAPVIKRPVVRVEEPVPEPVAARAEEPVAPPVTTMAPTPTVAPVAAAPAPVAPAAPTVPAAALAAPAAAAPAPAGATAVDSATRRREGGATVVRRASREEIESLQSQVAKRATGRKEDHRGTRVTGMGLLSNRVSAAEAGGAAPAPENPWADSSRRGGAVIGAPTSAKNKAQLEEEEQAKKKAAAKARRAAGTLSMRALLESAEDIMGGPEEDPAKVADPNAGQVKTVYTPQAPRSRREVKRRKDLKKTQVTTPRAAYRIVNMGETITVGELAHQMSVKGGDLIKKLMGQGLMVTINQSIDVDTATLLAGEFGFETKSQIETADDLIQTVITKGENMVARPPIVTVMGHVDHGKTSILDAIRSTSVASGEAGGITQHIGAYTVVHNGEKITFLDTPGHEAFSSMRARGAKVTDIVVLVVAADDGVMPQTKEAIAHAKAANVPIIVAVNKIDKPGINLDRVYTELTEFGIQAEEWGGETQFIKVSALKRTGISELLEAVALQAEVLDLQATTEGNAEGIVIEAHLDKGRGPVATMIVQKGTLNAGDYIVAGAEVGRVRAMHDHLGKDVKIAGPSEPVEIIGLSGVPMAGDVFNVVSDERTAREAAQMRTERAKALAAAKSSASTLEDLLNRVNTANVPEVPFIIKADMQGSLEAISESVRKQTTPKVKTRIVHAAVGGITESDITLASSSGAIIVGFNVRAARGLDTMAEREGVLIKYFSIIYEIVDAVKAIMVGKLPPIVSEVIIGHAEVRKPISVPKIGTIAGSSITDGKITRAAHCRLIRNEIVIYVGKLGSLRRFKDDVKEVAQGYECGIGIDGYNDVKEGDVIEAFVLEESAATLA